MKTKETAKNMRRKPGLLDVVIIVLIIAAAIFAIYFLFGKGAITSGGATQKILFAVEFRKMDPSFTDNIKVGEKVYDNEKGYYLGTVAGFEASDHVAMTPVPDLTSGILYYPESKGFLDVRLIIEGEAVVTDASTTINNSLIAVGEQKFVRAKSVAGKGYIVSIEF